MRKFLVNNKLYIIIAVMLFIIIVILYNCNSTYTSLDLKGEVIDSYIVPKDNSSNSDRYYLICKNDDYEMDFKVLCTSDEISLYKIGTTVEFKAQMTDKGYVVGDCQLLRK